MAIPHIRLEFPDKRLIKEPNGQLVRFGHLNYLVDLVNAEFAALPEGAEPAGPVSNATSTTDVVAQFNALLDSLRDAGILEENPPT